MPEHILFYGQPGLGKTTLANLISNELKADIKIVAAPGLQKIGDLVSLLVNLESNTVLFIDEIHRLRAPIEESLYTAMEDRKVDLVMGIGQGVTTARIDLNPFVLIGATTQVGKLSKPLRDRFPTIMKLEPYDIEEISALVDRNVKILDLKIDNEAKMLISRRCRGVPRIANNILRRFVDLQIVHKIKEIDLPVAENFLHELGIHELGLTKTDLDYLKALQKANLSLKTLSGILLEDAETLELVIEPYLINLGFIDKNSSGRGITLKGVDFFKKNKIVKNDNKCVNMTRNSSNLDINSLHLQDGLDQAIKQLEERRKERDVIIVSVAGGSASGKTTKVSQCIKEKFAEDCTIVSLDDYYKGYQFLEKNPQYNLDQPEVFDLELFAEHLKELRLAFCFFLQLIANR